jgi:hypothetical protein
MNQALYAHMNNKRKMKKKKTMAQRSMYRLGVQGVKVLILLGAFFLPSVAPASQQNF